MANVFYLVIRLELFQFYIKNRLWKLLLDISMTKKTASIQNKMWF